MFPYFKGILQHFEFENWRIGEFDFWSAYSLKFLRIRKNHKSLKTRFFMTCTRIKTKIKMFAIWTSIHVTRSRWERFYNFNCKLFLKSPQTPLRHKKIVPKHKFLGFYLVFVTPKIPGGIKPKLLTSLHEFQLSPLIVGCLENFDFSQAFLRIRKWF